MTNFEGNSININSGQFKITDMIYFSLIYLENIFQIKSNDTILFKLAEYEFG